MARGDRQIGTPEPLARLLARSEAVSRELERARDRLAEMSERFDADEPLTAGDATRAAPEDEDPPSQPLPPQPPAARAAPVQPPAGTPRRQTIRRVIALPGADEREPDIAVLQEAARRRSSHER